MPRVHKVNKARKDYPEAGIKKGDTYYWWQFAYSPKSKSLTYPRPQQLTQSNFLIAVYDIQEVVEHSVLDNQDAEALGWAENFSSEIEELVSSVEELRDETQNSLDNMPESLQYSSTGELLQERIDACESYIGKLESIDTDIDEDEDFEEQKTSKLEELANICFEI